MANGKNSFVLYCDMKHTVDLLDDNLAGKLFKHLLRYVNDENPETDDLLLKVAFEPIKRQLKRDLIDWEATREKRVNSGKEGGIKSGESRRKKKNKANEASALKLKQTEANEAVNVTVSVNDTVNLIENNSIRGVVVYNAESEILKNQIEFERICMNTGKRQDEAKDSLRKYHLHLEDKEQYPKGKKAIFAGFEKWLLNEKNFNNGNAAHQPSSSGSSKPGTSSSRIDKAKNW